jgi:FKBP-type peptidyl-prolyl cis-trans isomerase FkpA
LQEVLMKLHTGAVCTLALLTSAASAEESEAREREERRSRMENVGDREIFYALGALLGVRVAGMGLSEKEQWVVRQGFADAAAGKKLKLRDPDLELWGPRVDAAMARRVNPKVTAEKDRGAAFARKAAAEEGAQVLPSGVVVRTLKPGQGPNPAPTDRVRVNYEGKLIDGTKFDASADHGGPAELRLDQVIRCWGDGVPKMRVGEKMRLICPSSVAYGDQGRPPQIPGGATLIFEIDLLSLEK